MFLTLLSGIALVGALTLTQDTFLQTVIAFLAITFASINVFGGYLVTNRMLRMFKKNIKVSGLMKEIKDRSFYEKPSIIKRRKSKSLILRKKHWKIN